MICLRFQLDLDQGMAFYTSLVQDTIAGVEYMCTQIWIIAVRFGYNRRQKRKR